MKKSEIYTAAMLCVVGSDQLNDTEKLEIVEQLVKDKQYAELTDKKNKNDCEK